MSKKFFNIYFVVMFIFVLITTISSTSFSNEILNNESISLSRNFAWPLPGYSTITSKFGYRVSPTSGASSYHSGIDIAANPGSNIIAAFSGKVIYTDFYGANGFTVIVENNNYTALYSHVSPNFLVHVNDYVTKGQVIAKVGPKNVYNVPNNPYKDNLGNPTNGATTGPHLHFSIRKDGQAVNPLDYL